MSAHPTVSADAPYPPLSRAWTAVGVLAIATVFAFVDRHLLYILSEPVKQTLAISDTQISLLQGMAFVVFYALFGLPIGRLVDHRNRRNIVIVGIIAWSAMTIACGMATDFWSLAAARAGVGIGEACLAPAAFSMIADYFRPRLRGRAMACIVMSITLGSGCSYLIGAGMARIVPGAEQVELPLLGATYGWQLTFFAAALPGFLIAIMLMFIGEPPRRESASKSTADTPSGVTLRAFSRRHRTILVLFMLAAGLVALVSYAIVAWMTALYVRYFGYTVATIGTTLGLINIIAGLPGGMVGGYLSDFFAQRAGRGGRFNVMCIGLVLCVPVQVLWPMVGTPMLSFACLAGLMFLMPLIVASIPSALQAIVPNQFRGQMTAVLYLINGMFGVAFGPLLIALGTDYLFIEGGLRRSLLVILPALLTLALVLVLIGRPYYERARREMPE